MLCRTSTLRNAQRQSERREEALFAFMRECLDRVAALADKPWTLPPRPIVVAPRELTLEEQALRNDEREQLEL